MIYISTGGFYNITGFEACNKLNKEGIYSFELSGGRFDPDVIKNVRKLSSKFDIKIHNYFPPPKNSFVLNLASNNEEIGELTFKHLKSSIKLSAEINSKFYSFHSGFLIDPKVDELGKRISKRNVQNREEAMEIFLKRVNDLAEYANNFGIEILIENNVISANNFREFGKDVLLMTGAEECEYVFKNTPNNVNMLLDVAHLKVSSTTLNFSAKEFIEICNKFIKGYHISDNDGLSDTNNPIKVDSWFWKYLNKNLKYYTIEVYNLPFEDYLGQYQMLNNFINSSN